MLNVIANLLGLIGVGFILTAYLLSQMGKLLPNQLQFPVINLIGAVLILISLLFSWNLPSFVIEVAWLLISLYGIWRIMR